MMESKLGQVLVVDDEVELKNVLVQALTQQGYDVRGCTSGPEALGLLREHNFDVVLTDLMMPEMDGITLLKSALEIDPHLGVVMMTGHGTIQTAVDAMKFGAFDYVLKPFRLQGIAPVLARAMNARRLHLENVHLRETVAIHELSQTIAFTLDQQTVLNKLADASLQQTEANEVSILLPTAAGDEFYVAAVRGERRERLLGERVPYQQTISSWVARERQGVILNGEVRDERFVALWPRPEIRSAISLPMQVGNKLIGVLNLNVTGRARPFTLGQMKALSILASTAAAALESASLYEQVKRAEKNFRSIFENAMEGIFQAVPDGRYLDANPAMARILGYDSPADLIQSVEDIGQQIFVDSKCRAEALLILEKQGVLKDFEVEAYRKDGETIWVSMNIRPVRAESGQELYCEGTLEDITERKHHEDELRKLSLIVENSRDLIGVASPEGPLLFLNRTGQQIVGLDGDAEVFGTQFMDYVADEDRGPAGSILQEVLQRGHWEGEMRFRNFKTGAVIPMLQHAFLITDTSNNRIVIATICRDITERKRAEAELSFQKSLLESQSEASIDGILAVSTDRRLLSYNRRFLELWDLPNEVIASHADETALKWVLGKVENPKEFLDRIDYLYEHPAESSQDEIFLKDGRVFDRYSAPIGSSDTEYYGRVWFFHDITERKQSEVALRESEERYRDLVENAQDIIYSHDLEGNYTASNKAAEEITGYTIEEAVKLNMEQTIAPEFRGRAREMLARKLAGEKITAYELEVIARDGHRIPVEVNTRLVMHNGVAVGVTGVARDISERKRAEADLAMFRRLVDHSNDGIYVIDLDTGSVLDVNEAACRQLGYERDELLKLSVADLNEEITSAAAWENHSASLQSAESLVMEFNGRRKDGFTFPVEASLRYAEINDRGYALAIIRDITDRKRAEDAERRQAEELRERNDELTRFNRLTVGRELRLIELKQQVNDLSVSLGQAKPYPLGFVDVAAQEVIRNVAKDPEETVS